jgi:hypothetical protein
MVFSRPQVDDYNPLPNAALRHGSSRGTKSFNSRMVGNPSTTSSATSRVRLDPNAIIDGRSNSLLAPEVPFGRLN